MAPSEHAKLSPSAAKRWFHCPGSIHLEPRVLDAGSKHSDAGTAGHLLFEKCLKTGKRPRFYVGEDLRDRKGRGAVVTEEMAGWVDDAVRWVRSYLKDNPGSTLFSEERVDVGLAFGLELQPAEDDDPAHTLCWGTSDLFIISPKRLVVFDLKLGYVDVEVENNDQLMLYLAGFEHAHAEYEFEEFLLVILQPRSGGPKEFTLFRADLEAWKAKHAPLVRRAVDPAAPLVPGEDACRWCPAAAMCPALREQTLEVARSEFAEPDTLSQEQLLWMLDKADLIRTALDKYEGHAMQLLALGQTLPGWKRVKSKGGHRRWKDEPGAKKALRKLGLSEDDYMPRELLSPAQAEKVVGRGGKELLAAFVEKPEGNPMLARETDPRPALPGDFEVLP